MILTFEQFEYLMNEGLIKTHDFHTSIRLITSTLKLLNVKFDIFPDSSENTFQIKLYDMKSMEEQIDGMLKTIRNILGYYPSVVYYNNTKYLWSQKVCDAIIKNKNSIDNITIVFESKFDTDVPSVDTLYHVTLQQNIPKIMKYGLYARSGNKVTAHPDRIYLCYSIEEAEKLMKKFLFLQEISLNIKSNDTIKPYCILKIQSASIKIRKDPNFTSKGVYTLENISPDKIVVL